MKKIAILQSNYIPWKGYFDLINMVDEFIIYDTVQYTKNDWRNRNQIKTPQGPSWLSIPVKQQSLDQKIEETTVVDNRWRKKHWKTLQANYSKAPYYKEISKFFEPLYLESDEQYLSKINFAFINTINQILGITTKIRWSTEFNVGGEKTEKLLQICKKAQATTYISGPAAKDYFDLRLFQDEGIEVKWMDYDNYPEYRQLHPPFNHYLSILDLLFCEGKLSTNYLKSFRNA